MFSATPLFCHALVTANGSTRIVQIYAQIIPGSRGGETMDLLALSSAIVDRKWILSPPKDPINLMFDSTEFGSVEYDLIPFKRVTMTGGELVPNDPSAVEIKLNLDGMTYPIRIHLGDHLDKSPFPRMAIEIAPLSRSRAFTSWSESGFFDWPIATTGPSY
jgi:hypothetical protein